MRNYDAAVVVLAVVATVVVTARVVVAAAAAGVLDALPPPLLTGGAAIPVIGVNRERYGTMSHRCRSAGEDLAVLVDLDNELVG